MKLKHRLISIAAVLAVCSSFAACSKPAENTSSDVTETQAEADTQDTSTDETSDISAEVSITDGYTYRGITLQLADFSYAGTRDIADYSCDDEDVMAYLQYRMETDLCKYNEITEGTVRNGDTLIIDYVGEMKEDGSVFAEDEGAELEIGSNSFIPGFESGLEGKEIGSEVKLDLTFPDDYWSDEMRSAETVFTVTIRSKKEIIPQEINDAFISENFRFDSLAEYIEDYKKNEIERQFNSDRIDDALSYLIDFEQRCIFDPNSSTEYSDELYENNIATYNYYAAMYGESLESYVNSAMGTDLATFESMQKENAVIQANREAMFSALCASNGISATDEITDNYLTAYIAIYNEGATDDEIGEQVASIKEDSTFMAQFDSLVLQLLVFENLFDIPAESVLSII